MISYRIMPDVKIIGSPPLDGSNAPSSTTSPVLFLDICLDAVCHFFFSPNDWGGKAKPAPFPVTHSKPKTPMILGSRLIKVSQLISPIARRQTRR